MTQVSSSTTRKTTTLPFEITCPTWCVDEPTKHLADLWKMAGNCYHGSPTKLADDLVGLHGGDWETANHAEPIEVYLTMSTRPDGSESAPPVMYVNDRECSVSQALHLARILTETVEMYRIAGGRA